IAIAAGDRINATKARDRIVRGIPREAVVLGTAGEVLDVGDGGTDARSGTGQEIDGHACCIERVIEGVSARPAVNSASNAPRAAEVEGVVGGSTRETFHVGEDDAVNVTGARAADGPGVGNVGSLNRVGAVAAIDGCRGTLSGAQDEGIVAIASRQS